MFKNYSDERTSKESMLLAKYLQKKKAIENTKEN